VKAVSTGLRPTYKLNTLQKSSSSIPSFRILTWPSDGFVLPQKMHMALGRSKITSFLQNGKENNLKAL